MAKGKFKPLNPSKYKGDPTNIIYRSSWELKFFMYVDEHPAIVQWSSEEIVIPYRSPADRKLHRYYPDLWIKKSDGSILLIEIKPKQQCVPPTPEGKTRRRFVKEVMTYGINQAKWKSAMEYCADRKWKFQVLTEDNIYGTKKSNGITT